MIDRAIVALGGREKAAALESVAWTAVTNPGEITERKRQITIRGFDRVRMEIEDPSNDPTKSTIYILNGTAGWRRDRSGSVANMTPAMFVSNRERFYAQRLGDLLSRLDSPAFSITHTGDKLFGKRSVAGIRVEHKDHPTALLYFDNTTGLLCRCETTLSPLSDGTRSTLVLQFHDYRDRHGLRNSNKTYN